MLLIVHVTSFLFLVLAGNFAFYSSIGVTRSYSSHLFLCTFVLDIDGFHGAWLHFRRQYLLFSAAMCKIQARKRNNESTVSIER